MVTLSMEVVPEPKEGTATVFRVEPNYALADPFLVMQGQGNTNYVCGACRALLVKSIARGQLTGMVLRCAGCFSFNVARGT